MGEKAWAVGDKLFFVGEHRYNAGGEYSEIEKVGRKWLSLNNGYRVDRETLIADGGQYVSPGRAYASEDEYRTKVERKRYWEAYQQIVSRHYSVPSHLSIEEIKRMISALSTPTTNAGGGDE